MRTAALAALGAVALFGAGEASVRLRDVDGNLRSPLSVMGQAAVLFFIATDCPISNFFASEIQGICKDYGTRGVACSLLYEDVQVDTNGVRKHMADFQYRNFTAFIDADRKISTRMNAAVTPSAVVLDRK